MIIYHKFLSLLRLATIAFLLISFSNAYANESKMVSALQNLGFNKIEEQEAVLNILYLNRYFSSPKQLWVDINMLGAFQDQNLTYKQIITTLKAAGAMQGKIKSFDAPYLLNNFMKQDLYTVEDVQDIVLYWLQGLFKRDKGKEYYSIPNLSHNKNKIKANLVKLNLINTINPRHNNYDEIWVLGANRVAMITRIGYVNHLIKTKNITYKSPIKILTGNRILNPIIDGIPGLELSSLKDIFSGNIDINNLKVTWDKKKIINNGKNYIKQLNERLSKIDDTNPLDQLIYSINLENDRFFAPDYSKTTETMMIYDILKSYSDNLDKYLIINAIKSGGSRPNTVDTGIVATKLLISNIKKGYYDNKKDINILVVSNQPYVQRQVLEIKYCVNRIIEKENLKDYNINYEGVGFNNKQNLSAALSQLAAKALVNYRISSSNQTTKRNIKSMLFQTRSKDESNIPPTPSLDIIN